MPVVITSHPLVQHKLTFLRNAKTSPSDFRHVLKEITFYLGYEATRDLKLRSETITTTENKDYEGQKISQSISIIPILRAGLGMVDALLELMPYSTVHHLGLYRTKDNTLPVQYYNRLPRNEVCDVAYIVDAQINTSYTLNAACSIVKRWGAKKIIVISVIAARDGLERLVEQHPDITFYLAAVDEELSADGVILPGIGDAGDRLFGKTIKLSTTDPTSPKPNHHTEDDLHTTDVVVEEEEEEEKEEKLTTKKTKIESSPSSGTKGKRRKSS